MTPTASAYLSRPLRSESQARADLKRISAIGRFFLIEVDHRDGSYFTETSNLPRGRDMTRAEGLAELQQHDDALAIYECHPEEGSIRDVSEDFARLWLEELAGDTGFDPYNARTFPRFIGHWLTNDAVAEWAA